MWGLSHFATKEDVIMEVAKVLHRDDYRRLWGSVPANLDVRLFRRGESDPGHNGRGTFTVAIPGPAYQFLKEYGGDRPRNVIRCRGKRVFFREGEGVPPPHIVEKLLRTPYVDPYAEVEKQERIAIAEANQVPVRGIEFGWECRDRVFSCEWEKSLDSLGCLAYNEDRRELRVVFGSKSIALPLTQIDRVSCGMDGPLPVIFFVLKSAPIFEEDIIVSSDPSPFTRTRISSLDPDHERIVAYISLAVRFICDSGDSLETFRTLCGIVPSAKLSETIYPKEHRELFSTELETQLKSWLVELAFGVAFQVEKVVRDLLVDFGEMLAIKDAVGKLVRSKGVQDTAGVLQWFHSILKETAWNIRSNDIPDLFLRVAQEYVPGVRNFAGYENPFLCYHVSVTPTGMKFNGPFQEQSNRVLRRYPDHHSCFIRVSFEEETRSKLRSDREVDGAAFVKRRYGTILREGGLEVGGRQHKFLAYSQSALKGHSVWFMRPFEVQGGVQVDPQFIINSLGDFDSTADPELIRCPGRYAARISQAFTSTDSGVSVEPKEIRVEPDIEVFKIPGDLSSGKWNFTDGVGTISPELADEIWDAICARQRNPRLTCAPRCFQIRFQGCKGMVSVDHRQRGRKLVLRPSMIKFEAPKWSEIEIVQAFDRPSPLCLNRPLVMILEGLGVDYQVFKNFQDEAVRKAQNSKANFKRAGHLLESSGLGTSFRLPSIMHRLHELGVPMQEDPFYDQLMKFAIHHVLRELKYHARIPVPGYTLVGVADVHGWLEADEVFACFFNHHTKTLEYLEGDMVITRSPVIHPGDVQIVRAIGHPPPGSPFEKEPLPNAVVFSIKGDRPMPSKMGGGDLDGDLYNIASLSDFPVRRTFPASPYSPAVKKLLNRKCTMDDVADFVTEYINSDVLGLIAINWRIIADRDTIFDIDCLTLAGLHSDAADYPKTSTPVPLDKIPRSKSKEKPDWSQPETMNESRSAGYYESTTAIGQLYRAIQLSAPDIVRNVSRAQRKKLHAADGGKYSDLLTNLSRMALREDDLVDAAVCGQVAKFIDKDVDPDHCAGALSLFERYAADLKIICAAHTLSYRRGAMLTEEEAAAGTIVARTSQPRSRLTMMSKLREQMDILVKSVRSELVSEEDEFRTRLSKAWALWRVTQAERELMGARTLGLIALGSIFDTIKEFELGGRV